MGPSLRGALFQIGVVLRIAADAPRSIPAVGPKNGIAGIATTSGASVATVEPSPAGSGGGDTEEGTSGAASMVGSEGGGEGEGRGAGTEGAGSLGKAALGIAGPTFFKPGMGAGQDNLVGKVS